MVLVFLCAFGLLVQSVVTLQCESQCEDTDLSLLNVHLVPHSHMDAAWIYTPEEYFEGKNARQNVQATYDSVVEALESDETRRFMFVESSFISMWFNRTNETMSRRFINLVNRGQIEIVSGGWSMNDEACTHYQSIIDQMTLGHSELNRLIGKCARPKIAWQIDPFGHSREFANLLSKMQFEALFFHRYFFRDGWAREGTDKMYLKWRTSDDQPSDLLTIPFPVNVGYCSPQELSYDEKCEGHYVETKESADYVQNVAQMMERSYSRYKTSNILIPIGSDFAFRCAGMHFSFLDYFMAKINAKTLDTKINVFYSTPSCFLHNLMREEVKFAEKTGDFFPYLSSYTDVWTGYYTSRPAIKIAERMSNNVLQSVKQLQVLARLHSPRDDESISALKKAVALMQHHDAITGTSRQTVNEYYHRVLNDGIEKSLTVVERAISYLLDSPGRLTVTHCNLMNESLCDSTTKRDALTLVIHNSLAWTKDNHIVRLPWSEASAQVVNSRGEHVDHQIIPVNTASDSKQQTSSHELVFVAPFLPPMSLSIFHLKKSLEPPPALTRSTLEGDFDVASNSCIFHFNKLGQLKHVVLQDNSIVQLSQSFAVYQTSREETASDAGSDAYLFYPHQKAVTVEQETAGTILQTKWYTEVTQQINDRMSQRVRVNIFDDLVEFEYTVRPSDNVFEEQVVAQYTSDLDTEATFYTDANGRQLMKRVRNMYQREERRLHGTASNYYPVTSQIIVRDEMRNLQLQVFTDRSQGGTSLLDGQIELMINSMSKKVDHLGLDEALGGENITVTGRHKLHISTIDRSSSLRIIAAKLQQYPINYFVQPVTQLNEISFSLDFPPNVRLLSFEAINYRSTLVRLENIQQKSDEQDEESVQIDLKGAFAMVGPILTVREVTLSGQEVEMASSTSAEMTVTLEPMMIRTFIINFAPLD